MHMSYHLAHPASGSAGSDMVPAFCPFLLSSGLCLGWLTRAHNSELGTPSGSVIKGREGCQQKALSEAHLCSSCLRPRPTPQALPPGPASLSCAPGEASDHPLPGPPGRGLVPFGETEIWEVREPGCPLHPGHETEFCRTLPVLVSKRVPLVSPK